MLLRWLIIALLIYALYRLLFKPKPKKKAPRGPSRRKRHKNLDHIEEAEFEDITDKEKTD